MQETGVRRHFGMAMIRPVSGRDAWLALDDAHCDSRRDHRRHVPETEAVTAAELECYHRQLFYWLLVRRGPSIFPMELALRQGVPALLPTHN
jgi:hypothetical protein